MAQIKNHIKRIVLMIIIVSTILGFIAIPYAKAALNLGSNDFYYSGTTDGSYVEDKGVVDWLVEKLTQVVDYIVGIVTMGTRMVFVGYTALAEHALTWFLESMSGINLNGEDISSTNLTQLNDSSKNVTVQAIVYNRVPALNVNFFKLDLKDLFKDGDKIVSPTGIELKCKKCGKPVKECMSGLPESGDINTKENHCNSDCRCNGKCSACQTYAAIVKASANTEQMPMIFRIKHLVAVWYRLITLLSFAAMLVALIVLGIKLAISNVVTDKALYKSMLVDWFVGMVIVAGINLIMYFAITVNEMSVSIVADAADDVNRVQIMHMTETDPDKLAEYQSSGVITLKDQEIEIDVYEAIRTRAYDAKLTVGTSGMIMYITLVYYAFRYTMMYLRRFLNLAILTIMGPAIGVSYAMQKILHGKGMSFKNWLQEYILTLFIQVIHAIMYGVFISQALVFSLESVGGMIFGLVMMHYTFKLDKLFRKIFNFGEGRGMKDLDSAGDLRKRGRDLKNLRNAMGAGAVGGMILSSPAAKVMRTAGRAAGSAAVIGTAAAVSGVKSAWNSPSSDNNSFDDDDDDILDSMGDDLDSEFDSANAIGIGSDEDNDESQDQAANSPLAQSLNERRTKEQREEDRQLLVLGRGKLRRDLAVASDMLYSKPTLENRKRVEEAKRRLKRYDELNARSATTMPTVSQVVSGKFNQVFNINTYIQIQREKDGSVSYKIKSGNATTSKRPTRKAIGDLLLGTQYYDPIKGKVVKEKNAAIDGLRLSNLLNFTDDDVREFKTNIWTPMKQGLGGMVAMGFGMATLVSNPKLGMALLVNGYERKERSFRTLGVRRRDRKYNRRFIFSRFDEGAIQEICDAAIKLSREDRDRLMVARVKRNHYRLYLTMREELDKAIASGAKITRGDSLDGLTYYAEEPDELGDYSLSVGTLKALESGGTIFIPSDMIDGSFDIDDNFDDLSELKRDVKKKITVGRWRRKAESIRKVAEAVTGFDKVGKGVDNLYKHSLQQAKEQERGAERDTLELKKVASIASADYALKRYMEASEENQYEEMGYRLTQRDTSDGVKRSNIERTSNPSTDFDEETKRLSPGELAQIDQTIDSIIKEVANGKSIDVGSEKVLNEIIKKLGNKLFAMSYIGATGKPEDLFEDGYFGLKTSIKKRIVNLNKIIEDTEDHLKGYSAGSSDLVMGSIQDLMDSRSDSKKRYKKLSPLDVIEKLKEAAGITAEAKPESGIPHQEPEKASFKTKKNDGTSTTKTPTTEEVGRFIISREIVEVDQEESRSGEKSRTYSREEVNAAKQYLEHMSKEEKAELNRAIEAVINQPITENDIIEAMAERIKNEDRKGKRDESTSKKNIRNLVREAKIGERDSSDSVKEARTKLKTFVKKELLSVMDMFNGSLNVEPDNTQVEAEATKAHARDAADMMDMIEMAFMGDGDTARQMIEDSDSSDKMKRLQLDTLLAFEKQVETIEDLNEYAMRNEDRLGMENAGPKKYKELRARINDDETEINKMKLRVARFEREHGMFETIDYERLSDVEKIEYGHVKQLREQIAIEERKIEQARDKLRSNGPVGNVRDLIVDKKKTKKKK